MENKKSFSLSHILRKMREGHGSESEREEQKPATVDNHGNIVPSASADSNLPQSINPGCEEAQGQEMESSNLVVTIPDDAEIAQNTGNTNQKQNFAQTPIAPYKATVFTNDSSIHPRMQTAFTTIDQPHDENQEEKIDFFRYLAIILHRKEILLLCIMLTGLFYSYQYMKSPKYYVATGNLLYQSIQESVLDESRFLRFNVQIERELNTHIELLRSKAVMERVSENLSKKILPGALLSGLSVQLGGEKKGKVNNLIEISFRHEDREMAQDVVNEVCRTYPEYLRDVSTQEEGRLLLKLKIQIDKVQTELKEKENALRKFKESNELVQLPAEATLLMNKLSTIELSLQQTQLDLLENRERLATIKSQINQQDINIVQSFTYQNPTGAKLSELELELNTLSTDYNPDHYKIKQITQQIEKLKAAMQNDLTKAIEDNASSKTMVKNPIREGLLESFINQTINLSALESKRIAQEQIIGQLKKESNKMPSLEQENAYLQRETESQDKTLKLLKMKLEETKIKRDSKESEIKILELSQGAIGPISSKSVSHIFIGLLVGLIIGIVIIFALELIDQSIKEPSDVEKRLETPLLGVIPLIESTNGIVSQNTDSKSLLEPFRYLRTNIKHIGATHNSKVFMVCSAVKGEGKTTLVTNLSIAFAMEDKKILLIDCDLRRSHVHSLLDIGKEIGLSDYLMGQKSVDDIIKSTAHKNLFVITSGERPPNPGEILGRPEFASLIHELRSRFDYIFCDSPALIPVSDSMTMLSHIDCCIMVFRALWTPIKAAIQAKSQLQRLHKNLMGGILNGMNPSRGYYPYYYGYYGYYSYKYKYIYDYEHDPRKKLTLREFGLEVDKKVKTAIEAIQLKIPRYRTILGSLLYDIFKRPFFWILVLTLSGLSIVGYRINLHLQATTKPYRQPAITYQGPVTVLHTDHVKTGTDESTSMLPALSESTKVWATSLIQGDTSRFFAFYDKTEFMHGSTAYSQWHDSLTAAMMDPKFLGSISISGNITTETMQKQHVKTQITLQLKSGKQISTIRKMLLWRIDTECPGRIVRERELQEERE